MAKASQTPNLPVAQSSALQFALMAMPKDEIKTILHENLGGEAMTARDLPQIAVPAGGGLSFSIPSIDGPMDLKEVIGIIIATQHTRAYWAESFDQTGGGSPPDCVSEDGETGMGNPGGDCDKCPLSQFGSASKGRGKACSEKRLIFMALPDEILPQVFKAPPTSLKNAKSYLMGLTSRGKKLYDVLTAITLEQDKSKDGIRYSKMVFRKVGDVDNRDVVEAYAKAIKPFILKAVKDIAATRDPMDDVPIDS